MKEINITKHALMRYASRVYKYKIINDRTFDIWKKQNEDKVEGLDKYFKERDDLNRELELLKAETELLNSKLKTLKEKQARVEARQNEIAGEQVEIRNIIKVAEEKIVRSKLAL